MASKTTSPENPRFSAPIGLPVEMALAALPLGRHLTAKTEAGRILRRAMEEGICALAQHFEETGEWPREIGDFRLSVTIGERGHVHEFTERAEALEGMLAGIQGCDGTNSSAY